MKLPNFYEFAELNDLKWRMGIPRNAYGSLEFVIGPPRLTEDELDRLTSQDGLDIASLDDIRVLRDRTLAFKNSRVLLYIRDHSIYAGRSIDPKFHIANCKTLQKMKRQARFDRYVIATRNDGTFRLYLIEGTRRTQHVRKLSVCQKCLDMLRFDGFTMALPRKTRHRMVHDFTLPDFFQKFSMTLHPEMPLHNDETAPINDYAQDFSATSNALRAAANWTCENPSCRVWLGDGQHHKFLHVHHLNGVKSDDGAGNHRVLCIGCHAEQPNHGHMKSLPEYRDFSAMKSSLAVNRGLRP